jgi:hypothetical protein
MLKYINTGTSLGHGANYEVYDGISYIGDVRRNGKTWSWHVPLKSVPMTGYRTRRLATIALRNWVEAYKRGEST